MTKTNLLEDYFQKIEKEYFSLLPGPDEFTVAQLAERLSVPTEKARKIIGRQTREGKLTHRVGYGITGRVTLIYKIVSDDTEPKV